MGIFTSLDAVNEMLGLLGEAGVNALDEAHPLITNALSTLKIANAREQGRGWWFNTEVLTLNPNGDQQIIVPSDILHIDPSEPTLDYTLRGSRLYRMDGVGDPYAFDGPVTCSVVRLLPFDDLPTPAQLLVSQSAQLAFVTRNDGDESKIALLRASLRDALVALNAEHIRAKDANLLSSPSFQATFNHIRGQVPIGLRHR